jgi:hypothetical protein
VLKHIVYDPSAISRKVERGESGVESLNPFNTPQEPQDNQSVGFELYLDNELEPAITDSFVIKPTQFGQEFETTIVVPVSAKSMSPKVFHRTGKGYEFLGLDIYYGLGSQNSGA